MLKIPTIGASNRVALIGDINEAMVAHLADSLAGIQAGPIVVTLVSDGGSHYASLAIIDMLEATKREIIVQVYGYCMSAAVLILASAHGRYMSKNSWAMVHEDSGEAAGEMHRLLSQAQQALAEELQWCALMKEFTGHDWSDLSHKETYLSPIQCKALNLIDVIGVFNG